MSPPRNSRAIRAQPSRRTGRKVRRTIEHLSFNKCDGRRVSGIPDNIVEQGGVSHNFVLFGEIEQLVNGEMVIVGRFFFIEAAISRQEMAVSGASISFVSGHERRNVTVPLP
ncbi:hypothetical protein U1Q18_032369 [Sarracenia purpurea var. burkii]